MITIDTLISLCGDMNDVVISQHAFKRLRERSITINDILNGIRTGEIIEDYPGDYPYPSCLVLGFSVNNTHIHIVCGVGDNKLWIISAYNPTLEKWEDDYKTRKVVSK